MSIGQLIVWIGAGISVFLFVLSAFYVVKSILDDDEDI